MARSSRPGAFLTPEEAGRVEGAIQEAERQTSGEIRVVISRTARGDPLEAARERFARLRMHETQERNAVLVFLAVTDRRFAILGDEGIHRLVGQEGWDHLRDGMAARFREDDFAGGLAYAVAEIAQVLREHFPWHEGDVDELPNEIFEE